MNRRTFFASLAPACLAPAWFGFGEPHWFEVSHTRVPIPGIHPKRILHISDIHISDGMGARDLEPGLRAGLATKPDLICLTGDFVSTTSGFDANGLQRLLRMAADTAPSYAVLGNHDGGAWIARFGGNRSTQMMRDLVSSACGCFITKLPWKAMWRWWESAIIGVTNWTPIALSPQRRHPRQPSCSATIPTEKSGSRNTPGT